MRPFLLALALIWVASAKLHATESLDFNGGGYSIRTFVGMTEQPVVATVQFTPPGAKTWVVLPDHFLRIEKFDMEKRILIMHFSSPNDPALPGSFLLSVKKGNAHLSIGGKKIKGTFDWDI